MAAVDVRDQVDGGEAPPVSAPSSVRSAPETVEICTLGPLRVRRGGHDVALRPAQRHVLAVLVASAPGPVSIDGLIGHLWGDDTPRSARSMVHVHVSGIRRALGPVVVTDGSAYRIGCDVSLTVEAFRREVDRAAADECRAPAEALESVTTALARRRARAYPELDDHSDGRAASAAVEHRWRQAVAIWTRLMIEAGRAAETIETLDEAVVNDPLHEPYRELVMRARYATGDHVGAVRSFAAYRRLLASEVGLEPGPSIIDLERRILLHSVVDDPSEGDDGGVPGIGTVFVGRNVELDLIDAALGHGQLVSLLGPPGIGKTCLALEVARRRRSAGDRVNVASLVGVIEQGRLRETIDRAVAGLTRMAGSADRDDLIVIDNADEHAVALRRMLPRLMASTDRLRVLVTSRRRIGVPGERVVAVGPFAVPDPGHGLDELLANPAVQLFVDSVRRVAPRFRLTADNLAHAVAAVARTDGVPLSIELAAAWVPAVGVAGLSRPGPNRRALTETISDNLATLDADEWSVMQAAATVSKWFDVEMLRAVVPHGGANASAKDPVASALLSLIDRSLIESEHRADGRVRHRLLEPVRETVLDRMDEATRARTRRAHRELIRTHARLTFEHTGTADEPRRFAEVDEHFDDYRAVIAHAVEDDDASTAVEIVSSIWRFWFARFRIAEGVDLLRGLEQAVGAHAFDPLGARTLGWLLYMGGRHHEAGTALDRAVALALERDRTDVVIRCRLDQAQLATGCGEPDRALVYLADARGRRSRHGWPWADAVLRCRSGAAFAELGHIETAMHHLDRAVNELEAVGDHRELGLALALRSHMRRLGHDPEAALVDALAARRAADLLLDEPLRCTAGLALAPAAALTGDVPLAATAVADVATALPHDSDVDVCQLVLAGAAVAEAVGESDLAAGWVDWCRRTYLSAGVCRIPRLQADVADRWGYDGVAVVAAQPAVVSPVPSDVAGEVADFVSRVGQREGPAPAPRVGV